jgi:tetratricopeptide (TPR) repeat protein
MEVLIFLAIVAVIGYLYYTNLPETKFQRGEEALKNGQFNSALEIFHAIKNDHDKAGLRIAEIKFQAAQNFQRNKSNDEAISAFQEVLNVRSTVSRNSINKTDFDNIERKASGEIARIIFQKAQHFISDGNLSQAEITLNETLKWCNSESGQVKVNALNELAKIGFNKGVKHEKANNLKSALLEYKKAIAQFSNIDKNELYYQILTRTEICNLKQGEIPNEKNIEILSKQNFQYKIDLMYRYALFLANKSKIEECENIINKHLSKTSKDVQKLTSFCTEYYAKQASGEIDLINANLFSEDTKAIESLFNRISLIIPSIKKGLPYLVKDVEITKQYLFSKLINRYFEEEEFEKVLSHISSYPNFYEEPELLKNVGIACLRLVVKGKIDIKNYKSVVSTWLTAIYSDRVILKSLDLTTWDDDYTFTLAHSIGSHYKFDNDVENVNFDEVSDDNISIGATQKELVRFFETTLNELPDIGLLKSVLDFYTIEKEALENIIETISTELTYCTPYFAKQHNLSEVVLNHLSVEFQNKQDESMLELGLRYVKDGKPMIFEEYLTAQNHLNAVISAIESKNISSLKAQKSTNNSASINKFSKLKKGIEGRIIRAFTILIEKEEENETLFELFEEAINISPSKEQLKYQYSMFIVDLCVAKINKEKMKHERGLSLLTKAFQFNSENPRVAHNLAIVTKFNCLDMLNDGISSTCRNQLQGLIQIRNGLLKQSLRSELEDVLNGVFQQIRKGDPELVKLLEDAVGINRQGTDNRLFAIIEFDSNRATLNSAGMELAQKLKLIKNLID